MSMFQDTLAAMRGEDGSLTIGDDFEGSLTSAYDADMVGPNAMVEQLQLELEAAKAELTAAQAANWVLVQGGYGLDGSAPGEGSPESDPENAETDAETDPDDISEDDFLGTDDDKDND